MSTPGKLPLSQQGRTPSQQHHGAGATPAASTPFSITQAAFSPHGPRSSPQQVKKSPATMTAAALARSSIGPINFDSPSVSAALNALDISAVPEPGFDNLSAMGIVTDDDRARRLDSVINILSRSKGLVSEAGLERLAKKLELEFMWENSMGSDDKKTLIIAGSALELLIEFSNNVVHSVTLGFPDSAEIVNKHAEAAGKILLKDLQLREGQSPLTKSLDRFAANFERLAKLDKLSVNPGLNMYEAVAGIYESLCRLHAWELQRVREENPSAVTKGDSYVSNLVMCTKSGKPAMNGRGRVGMALDYWKEDRYLAPPAGGPDAWDEEEDQTWSILIGCAPFKQMGVSPIRISDMWIGPDVVKMPLQGDLHADGPIINWLEPPDTIAPPPDPEKADPLQAPSPSLGINLPNAVFQAVFDPPVPISFDFWREMQERGCVVTETEDATKQLANFDSLILPVGAELSQQTRTVVCDKKTLFVAPGEKKASLKSHHNTLDISYFALGRTLSEMTFSHPQQLIAILPNLRQYIFLATLLKNSFKEDPAPTHLPDSAEQQAADGTGSKTEKVTTLVDDYHALMGDRADAGPDADGEEETVNIDMILSMGPETPMLKVAFPFRPGQTANVAFEIQKHGHVHVLAQSVLDERNMVAPNGRQRKVEDIGELLERFADIGKWVEFMRTRWA